MSIVSLKICLDEQVILYLPSSLSPLVFFSTLVLKNRTRSRPSAIPERKIKVENLFFGLYFGGGDHSATPEIGKRTYRTHREVKVKRQNVYRFIRGTRPFGT